jgi:hypothetical protein
MFISTKEQQFANKFEIRIPPDLIKLAETNPNIE